MSNAWSKSRKTLRAKRYQKVRRSLNDMVDAGHARTSYSTKENKVVLTLAQLTPGEETRVKRGKNLRPVGPQG